MLLRMIINLNKYLLDEFFEIDQNKYIVAQPQIKLDLKKKNLRAATELGPMWQPT